MDFDKTNCFPLLLREKLPENLILISLIDQEDE